MALATDKPADAVAPCHRKDLGDKIKKKTEEGWDFSVVFHADHCVVTVVSDPTKQFTLELGKPGSCNCGESLVKGIPCDHEMFAAKSSNRSPAESFPVYRTVGAWRVTYEAMVRSLATLTGCTCEITVHAGTPPDMLPC